SYTVSLTNSNGWTGTISRVGLRLENAAGNEVALAAFALCPTLNELPDPAVPTPGRVDHPIGWDRASEGWVANLYALRPNATYRVEGIQSLLFLDADWIPLPATAKNPMRVPYACAVARVFVRGLDEAQNASIVLSNAAVPEGEMNPDQERSPSVSDTVAVETNGGQAFASSPGISKNDLPITRLLHTPNGPVLDIGGYRTPPQMYVAPYEICIDPERYAAYIRDFAATGIHLHSANIRVDDSAWKGPGQYDFSALDRTFGVMLRADPSARLLLRVELDAPDWWVKAHPEELRRNETGGRETLHPVWERQSLGSDLWQKDARDCLLALAQYVRGRPYAPRVWGALFCTSGAIEWVEPTDTIHPVDYSPAGLRGWRKWLRNRYATDAELRRAWSDTRVTLETAAVPSSRDRNGAEYGDFRDPARGAAPSIDYVRYVTDRILDLMLDGARALKEGSGGRLIIGVYYGYQLMGSAIYGFLHQAGHGGFGRALRSRDLSFFVSPVGYNTRLPGMAGMPMAPADACEAHGKLWIQEEDLRTYLDPSESEYDHGRVDTYYDTVHVLRREFGQALCSGWGLWWYEMNSVWFRNPALRAEISRMRAAQARVARASATPHAQIAVVLDEDSLPYLRNFQGNTPQRAAIHDQVDQLYRIGAPFDFVLLPDLLTGGRARRYRMYVFLNPWKVTLAQHKSLHARLKRDRATAIWEWGAGLFSGALKPPSVEDASALTGFRLTAYNAAAGAASRLTRMADHPLVRDLSVDQFGSSASQSTFLSPQDGVPLAWIGGSVGLAVKDFGGWRSVYLATPGLPAGFLRHLALERQIPVYSESADVLAAGRGFLMLHARQAGVKVLDLPSRAEVWDALQNVRLSGSTQRFQYRSAAGETRIFMLR
ncbi:MAG: beta-galactosidase, partial [Chloroflexi bacterium]|nr:beta-galactosidase [Chloroflexota bacterium]